MGAYHLVKNTTLLIDLPRDYSDNGWSISEGIATHQGCNAGYITLIDTILEPLTDYVINYNVINYSSGLVRVIGGLVAGTNRTANGTYFETVTTGADGTLKFYSDGNLSVDYLDIYKLSESLIDNSLTLAFNENANKFVTYYSYKPEFMIKFIDGFFSAKNGELWEHNVNEIRNNFYGEQFSSKITFHINLNPTEVKNFYSLRQKSNKVWSVPEIIIEPRKGKSNGQLSRLKKGRFKSLQGDWFADFLKDMSDPRFVDSLEALMKGADLQGNIMKITVQNDDIVAVKLLSMDITTSPQNLTY